MEDAVLIKFNFVVRSTERILPFLSWQFKFYDHCCCERSKFYLLTRMGESVLRYFSPHPLRKDFKILRSNFAPGIQILHFFRKDHKIPRRIFVSWVFAQAFFLDIFATHLVRNSSLSFKKFETYIRIGCFLQRNLPLFVIDLFLSMTRTLTVVAAKVRECKPCPLQRMIFVWTPAGYISTFFRFLHYSHLTTTNSYMAFYATLFSTRTKQRSIFFNHPMPLQDNSMGSILVGTFTLYEAVFLSFCTKF